MKSPYTIIIRPHITEKTLGLTQGDARISDLEKVVRKYTFIVSPDANKFEIKSAVEQIYNTGKKPDDKSRIVVEKVHTVVVKGKNRRVGKNVGKKPDFKKAIVTLKAGQSLEDFGV